MTKQILIAAGVLLSVFGTDVASANDYQVTVQRKKAESQQMRTKSKSARADSKGSETAYYQVTVTNRAFNKPSAELEARYVLFVERQKLGAKIGTEETERVKGEAKVEAMKPQEKKIFDTTSVELIEEALSGTYSGFEGGGRTRSRDSIQGIWIKLYDASGAEVGEYINPTTLRSKMSWE